MNRQALDYYMDMPRAMKSYLRHNGWHFSKNACNLAVTRMRRYNQSTGKMEPVEAIGKDEVEDILKRNGIKLENAAGYDHVYVANMIRADFWRSSIEDEQHMARMIKDFIDDKDQGDGFIFARWYSDMIRAGIPVEWEDME